MQGLRLRRGMRSAAKLAAVAVAAAAQWIRGPLKGSCQKKSNFVRQTLHGCSGVFCSGRVWVCDCRPPQ